MLFGVKLFVPRFLPQLPFLILLLYLWFFSRVVFPITIKHLCEGPKMPLWSSFLTIFSFVSVNGSTYPHSVLGVRNPFTLSGSAAFFLSGRMGLFTERPRKRGSVVFLPTAPAESSVKREHFSILVKITCSARVCTIISSKLLPKGEMASIQRISILITKRTCHETLRKICSCGAKRICLTD